MGACAMHGGRLRRLRHHTGNRPVHAVDVYVPGCPPRPETLIEGIMAIQRIIDEDGLPPPANAARFNWRFEPSYSPAAQPAGVPVTIGGKAF